MTEQERPAANSARLLEYDQLGSTQDEARAIVALDDRSILGVRAGYQASGRGRLGAPWTAPAGECLLVTYILYGPDCAPAAAGRLAFTAAVAVAEAIDAVSGGRTELKWPNDVRLSGRKVAGILIETAPTPQGDTAALIGIGINVNVTAFPAELTTKATSLAIEAGRMFMVREVEAQVRAALAAERERASREGFAALLDRWRARDATQGLRFRATDGSATGIAAGISDTGALLIRTDTGEVVEVAAATTVE